tara:strand:- start:18 stop:788 length:771 start_codon:yes stop_codon:yes gene_type:complete
MILNHKVFGASENKIIILHGLLGSLDNWVSVAKNLSSHGYEIILIDQRNHGKSFHADQFDYEIMSNDLKKFLDKKKIQKVSLIGHSMGGKIIMNFILNYPYYANKVIVVDILPKAYLNNYETIFKSYSQINLDILKSRNDITKHFLRYFSDPIFISFLSKNITRDNNGNFKIRFNLSSIRSNILKITSEIKIDKIYDGNILFLKGENSEYIDENGLIEARKYFPKLNLITIKNSSHWIHYENQEKFLIETLNYLRT